MARCMLPSPQVNGHISVAGYLRYGIMVERKGISYSEKMLKLEDSRQLTRENSLADPEKRDVWMRDWMEVLVF